MSVRVALAAAAMFAAISALPSASEANSLHHRTHGVVAAAIAAPADAGCFLRGMIDRAVGLFDHGVHHRALGHMGRKHAHMHDKGKGKKSRA